MLGSSNFIFRSCNKNLNGSHGVTIAQDANFTQGWFFLSFRTLWSKWPLLDISNFYFTRQQQSFEMYNMKKFWPQNSLKEIILSQITEFIFSNSLSFQLSQWYRTTPLKKMFQLNCDHFTLDSIHHYITPQDLSQWCCYNDMPGFLLHFNVKMLLLNSNSLQMLQSAKCFVCKL